MRSARLEMALATGAMMLPETGAIAVIRPRMGDDLSSLPKERIVVITRFRPDYDAFAQLGFAVEHTVAGVFVAAIVCLPRAKVDARVALAEAASVVIAGGRIFVDGQKTDGIDAIYKDIRAVAVASEALSKAHGKIFSFSSDANLGAWSAVPKTVEGGLITHPGVFSADAPDRGSSLLAAALPTKLPSRVVDLGAGWGFLSLAILARAGVSTLDLVEADLTALECARRNVIDTRAAFHWADATTFRPSTPVDAVVCNPPFHTSRDADPAIGISFIAAAHRMLSPSGALYLVANRHLPYDRVLTTLFRTVEPIGTDTSFKITRAALPIRPRS